MALGQGRNSCAACPHVVVWSWWSADKESRASKEACARWWQPSPALAERERSASLSLSPGLTHGTPACCPAARILRGTNLAVQPAALGAAPACVPAFLCKGSKQAAHSREGGGEQISLGCNLCSLHDERMFYPEFCGEAYGQQARPGHTAWLHRHNGTPPQAWRIFNAEWRAMGSVLYAWRG